ncbi:MAG: hypothetical protein ACFE0M_09320 [Marivirga sp.]
MIVIYLGAHLVLYTFSNDEKVCKKSRQNEVSTLLATAGSPFCHPARFFADSEIEGLNFQSLY